MATSQTQKQSTFIIRLLTAFLLALSLLMLPGDATRTRSSQNPSNANIPRRRNVLLIISDDQARDTIGAYGNQVIKTPNLDRLAREGVRFTNAFASVASCSPSRAVIYTGLHNHTNGQYGLAHNFNNVHSLSAVQSIPRLLGARGYRTGIIGKEHVKPEEVYPFQTRDEGQAVRRVAEKAREVFAAPDERPFFLAIGYGEPHRAGGGTGFNNEKDHAGVTKITYKSEDVIVPPHLPDTPVVRRELAGYYEAVSRLDQGVGMVMKALEESGKLDETLVIFLSDNGRPFTGGKTTLYDAGIHLPMFVRTPSQNKRGVVNNAMVSFVDILPTVLEWTGTPAPVGLPGRSLFPILEQENPAGRDVIYASHTMHEITMYYPMRAVRTRQHKLIWNLAHGTEFVQAIDMLNSPTWQSVVRDNLKMMGGRATASFLRRPEYELYDLTKDPDEFNNVADDPAHAAIAADLKERLKQMMVETKDPWSRLFTGKNPGAQNPD